MYWFSQQLVTAQAVQTPCSVWWLGWPSSRFFTQF